MHQVRQLVRQSREIVVEPLDLTRAHPQGGVGVLADLGKRDAAARLGLSIELFFLELLAFAFVFRAHAALSRHAASLVTATPVSVPRLRDAATAQVR